MNKKRYFQCYDCKRIFYKPAISEVDGERVCPVCGVDSNWILELFVEKGELNFYDRDSETCLCETELKRDFDEIGKCEEYETFEEYLDVVTDMGSQVEEIDMNAVFEADMDEIAEKIVDDLANINAGRMYIMRKLSEALERVTRYNYTVKGDDNNG